MELPFLAFLTRAVCNRVCTTLVCAMDVRHKGRVRRLSSAEKSLVKSIIRPGDILLDSNDAYPGWQIASRFLFGSAWVHMGFYLGDGMVVDAGKETTVAEISLNRFLNTSNLAVLRPHYETPEDLQAAAAYARATVGRQYNRRLDLAQSSDVYCTQLIRQALANMPNPLFIGTRKVLGREIVAPQCFIEHTGVQLLWSSDADQNSLIGDGRFGVGLSGSDASICTN